MCLGLALSVNSSDISSSGGEYQPVVNKYFEGCCSKVQGFVEYQKCIIAYDKPPGQKDNELKDPKTRYLRPLTFFLFLGLQLRSAPIALAVRLLTALALRPTNIIHTSHAPRTESRTTAAASSTTSSTVGGCATSPARASGILISLVVDVERGALGSGV